MVNPSKQVEYDEPNNYGDPATDYTLDMFSATLASADSGLLEPAADLCDVMWSNSRVRGVLTTRITALLGFNNTNGIEFEADSARVKKAIAKDWFAALPEPELSRLLRWGLFLGIAFAYRKVTKRNGRWVPRIKVWHPRNFDWDTQTSRWTGTDAKGTRFTIEPGDPNWVIYTPFGEARPWAEGLWRTIALYWLIANRGWKAWGKHNDVHGSAGLVGKLPAGTSTNTADARGFFADLQKLAKNARIVIPDGYEINMLEAQGDTWTTFDKAIERADVAIAVTTLGQPLTTEVPNAAQTGATTAAAVRQDYLEFDAEQLSTWAHDSMFVPWAEWNFGSAELAPWAVYQVKPKEDLTAAASRLNTFADGFTKLVTAAPQVDRKALLERFDIPLAVGATFEGKDSTGEIFKYHLDYGVFTVNEIRASRGMPPVAGGDVPPQPLYVPGEGRTGDAKVAAQPPERDDGGPAPADAEGEELSETMTLAQSSPKDGFAAGQDYADRVAANARDEAAAALSDDLAALMHLIDELPDTPDWHKALRAKLTEHYGKMTAAEFARVAEHAMILAELAGRHAVLKDL